MPRFEHMLIKDYGIMNSDNTRILSRYYTDDDRMCEISTRVVVNKNIEDMKKNNEKILLQFVATNK